MNGVTKTGLFLGCKTGNPQNGQVPFFLLVKEVASRGHFQDDFTAPLPVFPNKVSPCETFVLERGEEVEKQFS